MSMGDQAPQTSSGTVARTAMLLRVMAGLQAEAGLGDIAERMRLTPSTTHRLLNLLLAEGFVERGRSPGSYRVGLEFVRIAGLVVSRARISERAGEFMQAVVDACDETCMLSVYVPRTQSTMITTVVHGSHPLRYESPLYVAAPMLWGAASRGVLAFLPKATRQAVLVSQGALPSVAGKLPRPDQIERDLAQVRERGYAISQGQRVPGAVGLSAPVFGSDGVVAALCITLPESRFKPSQESRLARVLMREAARFSAALGAGSE